MAMFTETSFQKGEPQSRLEQLFKAMPSIILGSQEMLTGNLLTDIEAEALKAEAKEITAVPLADYIALVFATKVKDTEQQLRLYRAAMDRFSKEKAERLQDYKHAIMEMFFERDFREQYPKYSADKVSEFVQTIYKLSFIYSSLQQAKYGEYLQGDLAVVLS